MLYGSGRAIGRWVLTWLLLAAGAAQALDPSHRVSEYTVTAWTMDQGLPHNLVHALAQDENGDLWIGSWEGPTRFNGRAFTRHDSRSVEAIQLAGTRALLRDDDGALLLGTAQNGVVRLAGGVWSVLEPTADQRLRALVMRRGAAGELWIGTDSGLWRLAPDGTLDNPGQAAGLPQGAVFDLLDLGDGGLLIGSERGAYLMREGRCTEWGAQHRLPSGAIRALLLRRDGSLAVAGVPGAFLLAPDGEVRQIFAREVEALLEDRDGALWFSASSGGLIRHHIGRQEILDERLGLLGRATHALMEDREGLIWMGTTNGLYRIADAPAFGLGTARGLGDNYPRTILHHPDGTLYVGHARGLDRWTGEEFRPVPLGVEETSVLSLAVARDGGLWVGTYDRGALHLAKRRSTGVIDTIGDRDGLPTRHVRALRETSDGSLWIGTTSGLVRRWPDGRVDSIEDAPGRRNSFVRGLAPARDGGLWIALDVGLMRWHPDERIERWMERDGFPGGGSFDVLESAQGTVFIASDRGLLRLRDGRFTRYGRADGLPGETLFRLLQDRLGALWMCSNQGALRIDPAQFQRLDDGQGVRLSVDVVDRSSGMPSSQCNGGSGPAGDLAEDGALWFPTALGVAVIDPAAVAERRREQLQARIESAEIDGQALALDLPRTLPATARRLVIRYVATNLRAPQDVRYRYRMIGFDPGWVEAGSDAEAVFTNLPSGPLRFEVQATMAPADWSAQADAASATLDLVQQPPIWLRPWFLMLVLAALIGVLAGVLAWRTNSLRSQQARLRRIIDERTRELSAKNSALLQADQERESLLRQLAFQARHDVLTGLPNRRAGEERLEAAIQSAKQEGAPLCLALMDVDHFKRINDSLGHPAGDAMLRHLGALLLGTGLVRPADVARHGGEEFLLILPGISLDEAVERLRALGDSVATSPVTLGDGSTVACSVSIGVAQWVPGMAPSRLVALADRRLYLAKQRGRDRVVAEDA